MTKYETSKFGDGVSSLSGGNVVVASGAPHRTFGARDTGGTTGLLETDGNIEILRMHITGEDFADLADPLVPTYLPAGSIIRDVWWDTIDVFAMTGTSPTVLIGTDTSEVTNGLVISKAVVEATNTARLTGTLTGTWAVNTPLQARTKIGFALGGTTPTLSRTGSGILTIEFIRPNVGKNM